MFETQEIRDNTKVIIKVPIVSEWSISELRKCCKKHKVKGYTKMDRVQLVTAAHEIIDKIKSR